MARSGRSFPSNPIATRKSVWTSGMSVAAGNAVLVNEVYDIPHRHAEASAGTAQLNNVAIQIVRPTVKVSAENVNLLTKMRASYIKIVEPSDISRTNFILRDIARLPFNTELNGYVLRFRIISHDRNRTSTWSPFYVVKLPKDTTLSNNITLTGVQNFLKSYSYIMDNISKTNGETSAVAGKQITITWGRLDGLEYVDVYEQFGNSDTGPWYAVPGSYLNDWSYVGRFKTDDLTNSFSIFKEDPPNPPYNNPHYRYSFNRPQTNPYYSNITPPPSYPINESFVANSRIYIATPSN